MNTSTTHIFSAIDPDVYKAFFVLVIILLVMRFIVSLLKRMLDHKLKNKIIDKGVSDDLAASILHTDSTNEKDNNIKWFAILLSTGVGLFIVKQYLPLGIHSIGIMAISIAIGFLAYSLYLKYVGNLPK